MSRSGTGTTKPVTVEELRRAWHALQDGQFRPGPGASYRPKRHDDTAARRWAPTEAVLPVLGCVGQCGASTLALAVATAASPARVVECAPAAGSGLGSAATAELGTTRAGWSVGRREQVWIARPTGPPAHPGEVPVPEQPPTPVALTVLDVGWDPAQVMAQDCWLRDQVTGAPTVLAVTTATVPGLRRLENVLAVLGAARPVAAVLGRPQRRWPRELTAALGPHTTAVEADGRLLAVPTDLGLAVRGPDTSPLPSALLTAAQAVLRHTAVTSLDRKEPPA
jgi:hypothetical protein